MKEKDYILATPAATAIIDQLRAQYGPIMFHLGGGCCGGNSPVCLEEGDLMLDQSDVLVAQVHDCAFWMGKTQLETRQDARLLLDVVKGGGGSFSLEIPLQMRFVLKNRVAS